MSERKDRPTSSSRSNAKEKETSHANREGQKWDSFQLFSCPSKVPSLSPPPLYPSLYLIPLLGTCFYYSGSNVARMGKGRGGRRGCPFLGNKGFVARSSFLLFPPILVLTRARREEGGEHIWRREREGGRGAPLPRHIILQSFLAFRISLFSSRQRRYFYPHGVRMVGQDFLKGELNWLN